MRPDTRSFSFTWTKGQGGANKHQKLEQEGQGSSSKLKKDEKVATKVATSTSGDNDDELNSSWSGGRNHSGSRLRKLSSSLVRLRASNKYANMKEVEDENNWHKIQEEPLSLEEDGDEGMMDISEEEEQPSKARPFQPLEQKNGDQKKKVKVEEGEERVEGEAVNGGLSLTKRLNKKVQDVKASLGNFSQRFRKSTRRRYRMGSSTPGSPTKKILGRTPTKLYSPFGFESPICAKTPKRLIDRPSTPRLARKSIVSSLVYSPSNNFRRDLDEARVGMRDFHILSRDITRRSVRF